MRLAEDDRVDAGPTPLGIQLPHPRSYKAEIERGFQMPVEVVAGEEVLQRDRDGLVEAAGFCGAEHGVLQSKARRGRQPVYRLPCRGTPILQQAAPL